MMWELELDRFLAQHPIALADPVACGYYAHLHLDLAYFSDYLRRYATFYDADGTEPFKKLHSVKPDTKPGGRSEAAARLALPCSADAMADEDTADAEEAEEAEEAALPQPESMPRTGRTVIRQHSIFS